MAAFHESALGDLEWCRFDVWAIVQCAGVATVEERQRDPCREWLRLWNFGITSIDGDKDVGKFSVELRRILRWEEQFGYSPMPDRRSLDALRDGFHFDVPKDGGHVLEITRPDLIWNQDEQWLLGLLGIASEYSRVQLAVGRKFFTVLVLPERSHLVGTVFEQLRVPVPFRIAGPKGSEFLDADASQ
ncbi:MAG TPA: hypothetical protein VF170_03710 [Planctomycetaceae bacterium]